MLNKYCNFLYFVLILQSIFEGCCAQVSQEQVDLEGTDTMDVLDITEEPRSENVEDLKSIKHSLHSLQRDMNKLKIIFKMFNKKSDESVDTSSERVRVHKQIRRKDSGSSGKASRSRLKYSSFKTMRPDEMFVIRNQSPNRGSNGMPIHLIARKGSFPISTFLRDARLSSPVELRSSQDSQLSENYEKEAAADTAAGVSYTDQPGQSQSLTPSPESAESRDFRRDNTKYKNYMSVRKKRHIQSYGNFDEHTSDFDDVMTNLRVRERLTILFNFLRKKFQSRFCVEGTRLKRSIIQPPINSKSNKSIEAEDLNDKRSINENSTVKNRNYSNSGEYDKNKFNDVDAISQISYYEKQIITILQKYVKSSSNHDDIKKNTSTHEQTNISNFNYSTVICGNNSDEVSNEFNFNEECPHNTNISHIRSLSDQQTTMKTKIYQNTTQNEENYTISDNDIIKEMFGNYSNNNTSSSFSYVPRKLHKGEEEKSNTKDSVFDKDHISFNDIISEHMATNNSFIQKDDANLEDATETYKSEHNVSNDDARKTQRLKSNNLITSNLPQLLHTSDNTNTTIHFTENFYSNSTSASLSSKELIYSSQTFDTKINSAESTTPISVEENINLNHDLIPSHSSEFFDEDKSLTKLINNTTINHHNQNIRPNSTQLIEPLFPSNADLRLKNQHAQLHMSQSNDSKEMVNLSNHRDNNSYMFNKGVRASENSTRIEVINPVVIVLTFQKCYNDWIENVINETSQNRITNSLRNFFNSLVNATTVQCPTPNNSIILVNNTRREDNDDKVNNYSTRSDFSDKNQIKTIQTTQESPNIIPTNNYSFGVKNKKNFVANTDQSKITEIRATPQVNNDEVTVVKENTTQYPTQLSSSPENYAGTLSTLQTEHSTTTQPTISNKMDDVVSTKRQTNATQITNKIVSNDTWLENKFKHDLQLDIENIEKMKVKTKNLKQTISEIMNNYTLLQENSTENKNNLSTSEIQTRINFDSNEDVIEKVGKNASVIKDDLIHTQQTLKRKSENNSQIEHDINENQQIQTADDFNYTNFDNRNDSSTISSEFRKLENNGSSDHSNEPDNVPNQRHADLAPLNTTVDKKVDNNYEDLEEIESVPESQTARASNNVTIKTANIGKEIEKSAEQQNI